MSVKIRDAEVGEAKVIEHLIAAAFAPKAFADESDASLPERLHNDGDLTASLVAVDQSGIIGQVALSPAAIGDHAGWGCIGPISVKIDRQGQGIGGQLMVAAEHAARNAGFQGLVLLGDPRYYTRFGFVNDGGITYKDLSAAYVMYKTFKGNRPSGEVIFAAAFEQDESLED